MQSFVFRLLLLLAACTSSHDAEARAGIADAGAAELDIDRTIRVEAQGHSDTVTSLAIDAGETLLLTGSADKTARLWNLADGTPRGVLRPPIGQADLGRVDAVALSSDGRLAAVGGRSAGPRQDAVLVFDTRTLRMIARLERSGKSRETDRVARIAFTDGGGELFAHYASSGSSARFDVRSQTEIADRSVGKASFEAGAAPLQVILTSGRRIARDNASRVVLNGADGRQTWAITPASLPVNCIAVSSDAAQVHIAAPDGTRVFSAADLDWVRGSREVGACTPRKAPLRLADGSLLRSHAGAITRAAKNGRRIWSSELRHRMTAIATSADGSAVVVALGDGTLRWLDAATGRERLAIFLHAKGGWVAWTPDGFFDHSEEAWNFAGWHVNRGPRQEAEFVKLAQLYDVAYRPDLIRLAYAGQAATTEAIRRGDAVDPRTRLVRGLPPRVAITASVAADRRSATINTSVEERGGGIGKLLYRVNGVLVAIERRGEQAPRGSAVTVQARRTVPLRNGPNQIEVVALDNADQLESSAVTTVAEGKAEIRPGRLWAVVVGINDYADPALRLNFAKPDAEAIAATLPRTSAKSFAATNVVTLFDAQATRANIARTVADLSDMMAEVDTFVLYLSGHGINLQGRYRYLTYDVTAPTPELLDKAALSQEMLQELLARVPAGNALVLLDTCYSGRAVTLSDSNMLIRNADRRLARATGRSVLAAATDQQAALEGYQGHGVLTWVLLQGLKGAAAPPTQPITARTLGDYAIEHVPAISAEQFEAQQVPVFSFVGRDTVLVRRGARK